MHEFAVASGIVDTLLEHARGREVEKVTLSIGLFSGVYADSLKFYIDLLFEDRGLKAPVLELLHPPARCRCACGAEYGLSKPLDACPSCGGHQRSVLEGRDCVIESLEVRDE